MTFHYTDLVMNKEKYTLKYHTQFCQNSRFEDTGSKFRAIPTQVASASYSKTMSSDDRTIHVTSEEVSREERALLDAKYAASEAVNFRGKKYVITRADRDISSSGIIVSYMLKRTS